MGATSQTVSKSDEAFSVDVKSFTVFIYEWGNGLCSCDFEFSLTFSVSAITANC